MKLCMIVNPRAGKKQGLAAADRGTVLLQQHSICVETLVSTHPGHTVQLARDLDLNDWDGVLAVGGDGTLFELINGLLESNERISIPIGQIPVGTGNSFIKDLGISTIEDSVEHIVQRNLCRVDLGHFSCSTGTYYFINLLGAGFVSNVAYRAGKYKALGALSYILGVIEEVVGLKSSPVTLEIDGQVFQRDAIFVEICNSRYTGGNMMMAPAAAIDDGLLDVVLLNRITRKTLLKLFPRIFNGSHIEAEAVEVFRGKKIVLRTETPLALTPDGETFGETPIEVSIFPGKVELFGCSG
jgi:YegS/Rv2252/BmrU family lipid kinase